MRRPVLSATSVVVMAIGCWGIHLNINTWLSWASVGGILLGGIILFVVNIPSLSEERSRTSD